MDDGDSCDANRNINYNLNQIFLYIKHNLHLSIKIAGYAFLRFSVYINCI